MDMLICRFCNFLQPHKEIVCPGSVNSNVVSAERKVILPSLPATPKTSQFRGTLKIKMKKRTMIKQIVGTKFLAQIRNTKVQIR